MRFNKAVEGLTLIAVGLIFLGNTTGALSWSVWISIFSLWPLLLVAAGVDLIGKALDNTWLRVLSSLVVLAGLVFGSLFMTPGSWGLGFDWIGGVTEPYSFSARADRDILAGRLEIDGAAGEIDITDGERLVEVTGRSIIGQPEFDVEKSGDGVLVQFADADGSAVVGTPGDVRTEVTLSRRVLWEIDLETGAAAIDFDLTDIIVSSLSVDAGVSGTKITLGEIPRGVDEVPVVVESGVSAVTIRVPKSAEVRFVADTGLVWVDVDTGLRRVSDGDARIWETEGYDDAESRYHISVDVGVGSVNIERYEEAR